MSSLLTDIDLNIVIRKTNADKAHYYAADAVQLILIKYFTLQVLLIKNHINEGIISNNINQTTKWLNNKCRKNIIFVETEIWEHLKQDFSPNKDFFLIKDPEIEFEPALVFWPNCKTYFPEYLNLMDFPLEKIPLAF